MSPLAYNTVLFYTVCTVIDLDVFLFVNFMSQSCKTRRFFVFFLVFCIYLRLHRSHNSSRTNTELRREHYNVGDKTRVVR